MASGSWLIILIYIHTHTHTHIHTYIYIHIHIQVRGVPGNLEEEGVNEGGEGGEVTISQEKNVLCTLYSDLP